MFLLRVSGNPGLGSLESGSKIVRFYEGNMGMSPIEHEDAGMIWDDLCLKHVREKRNARSLNAKEHDGIGPRLLCRKP